MTEEFNPDAFWEAYEELKQDREFFKSKIKEQEESESKIVVFPLTVKFQLDIKALEDRVLSISVALDDVMYELKQLRRRLNPKG